MRSVVVLALLAGCVPQLVSRQAGDRLGVHGKHLHFVDHDTIDGFDTYTFCRSEHRSDMFGLITGAGRAYDGACVVLVCPHDDDGRHCS